MQNIMTPRQTTGPIKSRSNPTTHEKEWYPIVLKEILQRKSMVSKRFVANYKQKNQS
jgi:hypothetical protein